MSTITPIAEEHQATLEDYVQAEQSTGERHELRDGKLVPMVGASRPHVLISGNLFVLLRALTMQGDCETYQSDMRVLVSDELRLTYPDVVVSDGPPKLTQPTDTLTNPRLIAEVLSPSTEAYDRGDKFENYSQIPSFKEYLLVSQDKISVTHFVRQPDDNWLRMSYSNAEDEITLQSLEGKFKVSEIYVQVDFENKAAPQ